MTPRDVLDLMAKNNVEMVDFRIVDVPGRQHHVTIPAVEVTEDMLENGVAFDGSSIQGFRSIENSDMVMKPILDTAFVDPFYAVPTLGLMCQVYEPNGTRYDRDPRYIAEKAESYLQKLGIATHANFGPELEFFLFDDVRFDASSQGAFYSIDSEEAMWNTGRAEGPNLAYKVKNKAGYFPVPPTDRQQDIRTEIVLELMKAGLRVERHHHEVATAGQAEINFRFSTLTKTADNTMLYKYIVRQVAYKHGKVATFMPKPIYGDNGSGMHVHQSLFNGDDPLFYQEGGYGNISDLAKHYIAGILTHAPAVLAFSNPSTNSYKRLVPGYEAPVNLVFSKGNRSAAIRLPIASVSPKAVRIEFRTPDATSNPYLAFSAMLMAGLDGIRRKLDPTELGFGPIDKNIYELSKEEKQQIQSVPSSFEESLAALENDHEFLLEGGVFSKDFIYNWINLKRATEIEPLNLRPHPYEFQLYLDL
ncbi:type I glutamate--ammonia ligase [Alicyclobacillus cycloheptanicus]|uniref:Glutamine synthetase n=1 Tax=Alicyclobacillus cycloheptanicus TaxID=1457 RepID=A0ABT9XN37_9BACL|nr:type I glutamate--ammonia ligase [Alicyclobacillus cycloheptanicus]MDQ0191116.1 glutamine synthetase [Alicyclobacillus cycloheptanicus]WDM02746.1 type I glutamate--ammonia ligase [Alicyclobacillus cycloheptanicus]